MFAWVLTADGSEILPLKDLPGSFFDTQGRALLDGHLDVPTDSVGFEGFVVDGKTYLYFGPFPAVLRLPVLAVTDRFDGRMSIVSIGVGWLVGAVFCALLLWRVRRFVRGDAPVTNHELAATSLALAAFGGGSSLVILAARPIVYQEADVWGCALTLASLWAVLGVIEQLTYPRLIQASAFATLAFLTRATLGLVATFTLAAVTIAVATEWWARRRHPGHEEQRLFGRVKMGWLLLAALSISTAAPIFAYSRINQAKFGTPFRLPMEAQIFSSIDPQRQEMLRANGNSFLRPGLIPTSALTYLRPDGIRFSRDFPFVFVPEQPQAPVGDYVFDRIDPTPGLLPTMPFWAGLAGWGLFCAFRPRPRCRTAVKRLRTPVIGAAAGTLGVLSIAFIAPRYLGDFLPFIVLTGAIGLYDIIDRTDAHRAWVQRGLTALLAGAAVFSIVVNVAIGYTVRGVEAGQSALTNYLQVRHEVGRHLGDPLVSRVGRATRLTSGGGPDELLAVGDCDALYWSDGAPKPALALNNWRPIERREKAGAHKIRVTFASPAPGSPAREPLLGADDPLAPMTLYSEAQPDGHHVRFGFLVGDTDGGRQSEPVSIEAGHEHELLVVQDPETAELSVTFDGRLVFQDAAVATGEHHLGQRGSFVTPSPAPSPTAPAGAAGTSPPANSPPATSPLTAVSPGSGETTANDSPTGSTGASSKTRSPSPTSLAPANPKSIPPTSSTQHAPGTRAGGTQAGGTQAGGTQGSGAGPATARISDRFTGAITPRPLDAPLCRALLAEMGSGP